MCAQGLFQCICFVQLGVLCPHIDVVSRVSFGCLLDSIVRSAERVCEGDLCCLGHRRRVSALCLLYKLYPRVDHTVTKYLKRFIASHNTRTLTTLGKMARVIPHCKTDQFSWSFLLAATHL